jgi:hypothetical protein
MCPCYLRKTLQSLTIGGSKLTRIDLEAVL